MSHKHLSAALAIAASLSASACINNGAPQQAASCGPEATSASYGDQALCIFKRPIIETRFDCPAHAPFEPPMPDRGLIVCAQDAELPSDFDDWLDDNVAPLEDPSRPTEPVITPPPAPETCQAGIGEGCANTLSDTSLSGQEIAQRLARALWADVPDATLAQAASSGQLNTRAQVRAQAQRMLQDPRARQRLDDFWSVYLGIDHLDQAARDPNAFPLFSTAAALKHQRATLDLIHAHTMTDALDTRDIFQTQAFMVDEDTAPWLDLDPMGYGATSTYVPTTNRAGVQTHPSFMLAHGDETARHSPSKRGLQLRAMLCQDVPPPPPDAAVPLQSTTQGTIRAMLMQQTAPPACAACHAIMDKPAFALENYDNAGIWRTTEQGFALDTTSDLDGASFQDAATFATLYHDDPRLSACITLKLIRHLAAPNTITDEAALASAAHQDWSTHGYQLEHLIEAILSSDPFTSP